MPDREPTQPLRHCANLTSSFYRLRRPQPHQWSLRVQDPRRLELCGRCSHALRWYHCLSPLKANGCGPGKTVGIVGVGGLGHFGVLFAKALGADRVVGISRKAEKKDDVLALGADEYIATSDDADWATKNKRSLDLIISTISSEKMPLTDYLGLLKTKGTFIQVG